MPTATLLDQPLILLLHRHTLDLDGCNLLTLPRWIGQLGNLTALSVYRNRLAALLAQSRGRAQIVPIDAALAARLAQRPDEYDALAAFASAQDFVERGLGFAALEGAQVMGAAYSSLVCRRGIEVSIFVEERRRGRGLATALACTLLLACLDAGREPHWDAANPASYKLALKLGYTFVGMYEAWYLNPDSPDYT